MALTFVPVAPKYKISAYHFDDEFKQDFKVAWDYLSTHGDEHLTVEFESASDREDWLAKAKAYGETSPFGEDIVVRRVKRTGSSDPNTGHLSFVMEAKSVAEARHARLRAEKADRDRRRENGEEIRHGKRRFV